MLTKPTHRSTSPVLPQGQPSQGGPRRKTRSELLVRNDAGGFYNLPLGSNNTAGFIVRNPSVRLVCMVAVTFAPDAGDDFAFAQAAPNAWLLTMDAWIRLSRDAGGRVTRANNIVTSQPLPFAVNEPLQGIDEIRGTVVAPFVGEGGGTSTPPGNLYVTATWEPAPGESDIPDQELQQIFGLADVIVNGGSVPQVQG